MEEPKQELLDEVDALDAILMDDVKIERNNNNFPISIETTVFPTTGDDIESQYVCITLQIIPGKEYPDEKPDFKLKAPRGLDDAGITIIERSIQNKLEESVGMPVVFDLIELIREHLNESNIPTGQCVICLYGFQDGDDFTKTLCYHYLHSHCLAIWLSNAKNNFDEEQAKLPNWQKNDAKPFQTSCPVCRESIDVNVEKLKEALPPLEQQKAPEFMLTDELKALQAEMAKLFQHQKEKGGIIDVNAEDKSLIAIDPEGAANEIKRRQETRANPQPNTSAQKQNPKPPKTPAKSTSEDIDDDEDDSSDDDRRRRGGRRPSDRYHKGKRERYHGRYRNQDAAAR